MILKLGEDRGLLLYYGVADYLGARHRDSSYVFGRSFTTPTGFGSVEAGKSVPFDFIPNDREAYRGKLKQKVHFQYTDGSLELWARYTKGGEKLTNSRRSYALKGQLADNVDGDGKPIEDIIGWTSSGTDIDAHIGKQIGYQQLTLFGGYTHEFSDYFSMDFALSYDMFDYEMLPYEDPYTDTIWTDHRNLHNNPWFVGRQHRENLDLRGHLLKKHIGITSIREDEYYARVLGRWTPNDAHSLALGFEFSHEIFGLESPGFPGKIDLIGGSLPAWTSNLGEMDVWHTNTYSILGEYQWQMCKKWTMFLGSRFDRHTYTDWMFSPRGALVWVPNEKETFKLMANQSVRREKDDELRAHARRRLRGGC